MPGHGHTHGWSREDAVAHLEHPDRKKTQDPEALWNAVGLTPGATLADIGAGTGYFAFPAARSVGPSGKVYAVDISEDLIGYLEEKRKELKLPNVVPVLATPEQIPLEDAVADFVLLANVLHDIPEETVREAVRLLRPGGQLVNLDWKKQETSGGPPLGIRLTSEEAKKSLERFGLRFLKGWDFGPDHYVITLKRAR